MAKLLDRPSYIQVLREAGVRRIRLIEGEPTEPLGESGGEIRIALALSKENNPKLDDAMRAKGYTGPGYTDRRTGIAYKPDIDRFLKKHKEKFRKAGLLDWDALERRMITNTAVHESWHAITQSTSHNTTDTTSVMYENPSGAALNFCNTKMKFTAGHRDRLVKIFAGRAVP